MFSRLVVIFSKAPPLAASYIGAARTATPVRQQVKPACVGGQLDVADFPSATSEPLLAGSVGAYRIQVGESVRFGDVPDPIVAEPSAALAARAANPGAVARGFEGRELARAIDGLKESRLVVAAKA